MSLSGIGGPARGQALAPGPAAPGLLPGMDATPGTLSPVAGQQKGVAPGFVMPNMESYHLPVPAGMRAAPMFVPGGGKNSFFPKRINPGTVLTGHLEDDLNSSKNRIGDIFSIRLEDGFVTEDGEEVIPKESKIVGIITSATAARAQHNGMPGKIDVSLQTLVFPDGRSIAFFGFIAHNPNMDATQQGTSSVLSGPINSMKSGFGSIFTAINSKAGLPLRMPRQTGGLDFKLDRGDLLPIKLNRPLDLANMIPAPAGIASSSTGYGGQPGQGFSRPNSYGGPSNSWSTASPAMPGFAGNPASNTVPNFGYAPSFSQAPLPVPERATAGLLPGISTPSTPISNMPEPF